MSSRIIDRIENRRFDKSNNLLKWLAIISLPIVVLYIANSTDGFKSFSSKLDLISFITPLFLFIFHRNRTKKWGGQFIEWKEDGVEYKSRESDIVSINFQDLSDIVINLDTIIFKLKNGLDKELLIEDYTEYEDRIRIKSNFESVKNYS